MRNGSQPIELGVDIGGTFTDFVLRRGDQVWTHKVRTTPSDPSVAVATGAEALLETGGVAPGEVQRFVHGTTLVANAILERRGVPTAFLTTEGFRDVLAIGRERRFDVYDLSIDRPVPIVPRERCFEVRERVAADGEVLVGLDEPQVRDLARSLAADGIESVAVSLLHAFRHAAHERHVRDIFAEVAPGVSVSISSDVAPEIGEYERASTVVLDAYVKPVVARYLARLRERLTDLGCDVRILLMQSNGGFVDQDDAAAIPIKLVESGPAAGCVFAGALADSLEPLRTVAFDMGGTTAKTCYLEGDEPTRTRVFEVARSHRFKRNSGLPVQIPAVDMVEIGAGGGSIAAVNDLGLLDVGPESASADPGPACYGFGGERPTVTDAALILGYLDSEYFLGGALTLDVDAAHAAMETVAGPLGMTTVQAAWAVHDVVTEKMAYYTRMHAMEKAIDLAACAIAAFGGAGPLHAYRVARQLGVSRIVVAPRAGVASALGLLMAPPSVDVVRGYVTGLGDLDADEVGGMLAELERQCLRQVADASNGAQATVSRVVDVRYVGQGEALEVAVPDGPVDPSTAKEVRRRFEDRYEQQYGRRLPAHPAETLNWRVVASGERTRLRATTAAAPVGDWSPTTRRMIDPETGEETTGFVCRRDELAGRGVLPGPGLVVDAECTTVLGSAGVVEVHLDGMIGIELG
jgi:N-methylhydantoinase A